MTQPNEVQQIQSLIAQLREVGAAREVARAKLNRAAAAFLKAKKEHDSLVDGLDVWKKIDEVLRPFWHAPPSQESHEAEVELSKFIAMQNTQRVRL